MIISKTKEIQNLIIKFPRRKSEIRQRLTTERQNRWCHQKCQCVTLTNLKTKIWVKNHHMNLKTKKIQMSGLMSPSKKNKFVKAQKMQLSLMKVRKSWVKSQRISQCCLRMKSKKFRPRKNKKGTVKIRSRLKRWLMRFARRWSSRKILLKQSWVWWNVVNFLSTQSKTHTICAP